MEVVILHYVTHCGLQRANALMGDSRGGIRIGYRTQPSICREKRGLAS